MADHMRWDWLDRYFSGECTIEQAREIERWIAGAPERGAQVETLRGLWARAEGKPDVRWNAEAAWRRLAPALDLPPAGAAPDRRLSTIPGARESGVSGGVRRRAVYAMRIAALLTLLLGGVTVWRLGGLNRFSPIVPIVSMREYNAAKGQRVNIALADGTRIVLAPGSTLRASRAFAYAARREVYLDGEGVFDVTHDPKHPFIVHTAYGAVEDLGTRFVVTVYPGDTAMRVVVADGIVAVRGVDSADGRHKVLRAGDLATVNRGGDIVATRPGAVSEYFSWTNGQLVFRDAPVRDVLAALARWYDVDIEIAPNAAEASRRRVTLTTDPGQPLLEIITAVTTPANLRAQRVGGKLLVTP